MWQADNDAYQLWRLRQELEPGKIDRLLDSMTTSDRTEWPAPVRLLGALLGEAKRHLVKTLYPSRSAKPIMLHPAE